MHLLMVLCACGLDIGAAFGAGQAAGAAVGGEAAGLAADRLIGGALERFPPSVGWLNATLDHFRFDDERNFALKYLVYDKFWSSPAGPIFLYLGNEGQIEDFYNNTGFVFEAAPRFGAAIAFVEHRYYGSSLPFGAESLEPRNLAYLTIEQAMADFALAMPELRRRLGCPGLGTGCGTVLFGGSYGGMLAAWFRVKYPHLSVGALAASAPVDFYPGSGRQAAFWRATLHTFLKYGGAPGCGERVEKALGLLLARAEAGDFAGLSAAFRTCSPLAPPAASAAGRLAQYVRGALASLAMLDYREANDFVTPLPAEPVRVACEKPEPPGEAGALSWLVSAVDVYLNYTGQLPCHNVNGELLSDVGAASASGLSLALDPTSRSKRLSPQVGASGMAAVADPRLDLSMAAWNYQACTELILEPLTSEGLGFYPPDEGAQLEEVKEACFLRFGVRPRPEWIQISTGGSLLQYASNIIFSNGEKDPWRTGAPDPGHLGPSVELLEIEDAAHHEDLRFSSPHDPPGLVRARAKETALIAQWLHQAASSASPSQAMPSSTSPPPPFQMSRQWTSAELGAGVSAPADPSADATVATLPVGAAGTLIM